MLIVWGETDSERQRGAVADRCSTCGDVAVLRVHDIYRKSHIYYIPLGSGRLIGTVLTCGNCGGKTLCNPEAYAQFLPEKQVHDRAVTGHRTVGQMCVHIDHSRDSGVSRQVNDLGAGWNR